MNQRTEKRTETTKLQDKTYYTATIIETVWYW